MYTGKRLNFDNIKDYLADTYGHQDSISMKRKMCDVTPLLQSEYGQKNDCSLVSITTIVNFLLNEEISTKEIYSKVEEIALKQHYNGETYGTLPWKIKKIFNQTLSNFLPLKHITTNHRVLKNIGYNWQFICDKIDANKPLILSVTNDGRSFYRNHSVVIIGYEIFRMYDRDVRMLVVRDNWKKPYSYIDFEKLSVFSSVNFIV